MTTGSSNADGSGRRPQPPRPRSAGAAKPVVDELRRPQAAVPAPRIESLAEPDDQPEPGPTWRPPPGTAKRPSESAPPAAAENKPLRRAPSEGGSARQRVHEPIVVGRYAMYDEIAAGGMATVHVGRLLGPVGFGRTVAIKRLHARYAKDPEFAAMFLDEARMAARIHHPNVVPTLDVVAADGELFIVMEYIHGASLAQLVKLADAKGGRIPLPIVGHLISGMLQGLHAAHEARSDLGELLGIVHRDVSPQNLLVGLDGMPRLVDFGVAKAIGRMTTTQDGRLKGKIGYMSPEQLVGDPVTRRSDIYGVGVVLWHALTGRRPVKGDNEMAQMMSVLQSVPEPPSKYTPGLPRKLDSIVLRAMSRDATLRYPTAADMATEFEQSTRIATQREVAQWMEQTVGPDLSTRAALLTEIEGSSIQLTAVPASALSGKAVQDDTSDEDSSSPANGISGEVERPEGTGGSASGGAAIPLPIEGAPSVPVSGWRPRVIAGACAALGLVGVGAWYFVVGAESGNGAGANAASSIGASTSAGSQSPPDAPPSSVSAVQSSTEPDGGIPGSASGAPSTSASAAAMSAGSGGKTPPSHVVPAGAGSTTPKDKLYVRE